MNINNLLEKVPVEKELPPEAGRYPVILSDRTFESSFYFASTNEFNTVTPVTHWLRPVTRESIEAFLREFGEKVWDACDDHALEYKMYPYGRHGGYKTPDKQTAITELINKTLGQ